jgi:hypothetical protein
LKNQISAIVLPQIAPFTFGDDFLNAGELASASCSITKGDSPITIAWFFNHTEIASSAEYVISKISRKVSALTIEAVRAEHMGEYTCVAKNAAGAANFSTFLQVNGSNLLSYIYFCVLVRFLPQTPFSGPGSLGLESKIVKYNLKNWLERIEFEVCKQKFQSVFATIYVNSGYVTPN